MKLEAFLQDSGFAYEAPRSLYVHVPFCAQKCAYCDFHSRPANHSESSAYAKALAGRVAASRGLFPEGLSTIYVGGGTPTVLETEDFRTLMEALGSLAGPETAEWTVEANPESLDRERIEILAEAGATRLSLGIQSMDRRELGILGRKASPEANLRALRLASSSGMDVSADLICGIPRPGPDPLPDRPSLEAQASILIGEGATHLSLYDLTVEEDTPLAARIGRGELSLPDGDEAQEERAGAEEFLARRGLARYEVSNFAFPGKESRHNMAYWSMDSYLGMGSSAVSTLIGKGHPESLRIEETPRGEAKVSYLDARTSAFEFLMMGLRTSRGASISRFSHRFGLSLVPSLRRTMERFPGRFREVGGGLALDGRGLDILNSILLSIMDDVDLSFVRKDSVQ